MNCKSRVALTLFATAHLLSACGTTGPGPRPSVQSNTVQGTGEASATTWSPPEGRMTLSPAELSPFLTQAQGADWELISITRKDIALMKRDQLLEFKLHWDKVVDESAVVVAGIDLATLTKKLGLAEEIAKADKENVDGVYRAYDLEVLNRVTVEVHTNRRRANRCSSGNARLLQLASATALTYLGAISTSIGPYRETVHADLLNHPSTSMTSPGSRATCQCAAK